MMLCDTLATPRMYDSGCHLPNLQPTRPYMCHVLLTSDVHRVHGHGLHGVILMSGTLSGV